MRIFNVIIKFLTPAIISAIEAYRGMLYLGSSNRIPGSTVRGALMTWALNEGLVSKEEVDEEAVKPRYGITPFLASPEGKVLYRDLNIAHALAFRFKKGLEDQRIYSIGINELIRMFSEGLESDPVDALSTLIARESSVIDEAGDELKCSANIEGVMGEPICRDGGEWRVCEGVRSGLYIGVSIDRERKSVVPGALFGYEYVEAGSTYTGVISCENESVMLRILENIAKSRAKVSIGKCVGRGYGLAEVSVDEVEPIKPLDVREGDYLALEVVGPLSLISELRDSGMPVLAPPEPGRDIHVRLGSGELTLSIKAVYGGVESFRGWSLRRGVPKASLKALTYGSIIIARVKGSVNLINRLPYMGINRLGSQGLNILLPLTKDFIPRYGGGRP